MNKNIGALCYQDYKSLIKKGVIYSQTLIPDNSIQPASIDLRVGKKAYEIIASFLAPNEKIETRLKDFKIKNIDLSKSYLFKKNSIYLIEIEEKLKLSKNLTGKCNPKSSTGRLDIFCRIITDYNSEYEIIKSGYKGKIYLEVTPKTFEIILKFGDKLSQLRLRSIITDYVSDKELNIIHKKNPIIFDKNGKFILPQINNGLKISANISNEKTIIAYKAKKNSQVIIFNKLNYYKAKDYWSEIKISKYNSIIIEPNEFYLLKSKEKILIGANLAAEMIPYDTNIGEFRVHYAGFFDPGFGDEDFGSYAVLEIKTYEVPFAIQDGQSVARLLFEKLAKIPDKIYGDSIKSNYQNQGLALSKHFKVLK